MVHIRIDDGPNDKRKFACGIGPELPAGDKWVGDCERGLHHMVDCPGCSPQKQLLGTPISELSGRPWHPGFAKFSAIAESWGY